MVGEALELSSFMEKVTSYEGSDRDEELRALDLQDWVSISIIMQNRFLTLIVLSCQNSISVVCPYCMQRKMGRYVTHFALSLTCSVAYVTVLSCTALQCCSLRRLT